MTDALRKALKVFADLGVGSGPDYETETYRIERGAIRNARATLAAADSNSNADRITEADIRAHVGDGMVSMQNVIDAANGILASRASAEARLRDALEKVLPAIEQAIDCVRGETPEDFSVQEARLDTLSKLRDADKIVHAALSPDPHASYCEKQSGLHTFAEMVKAAADTAASGCDKQGETTKSIPVQDAEPANVAGRTGGAHPPTGANPSDRPADVTVEELADFIDGLGILMVTPINDDDEAGEVARALLRSFTVGRR